MFFLGSEHLGLLPFVLRIKIMLFQEKNLLPKRISKQEIILGRAYIIHARNGGVGIATTESLGHNNDVLCYTIRRNKFGNTYLFNEYDWDEDPIFGTAIPLRMLEEIPPKEEDLLAWLIDKELLYRDEIEKTWCWT
jgi:hypothetical protein